jgi:hypothetical protein
MYISTFTTPRKQEVSFYKKKKRNANKAKKNETKKKYRMQT